MKMTDKNSIEKLKVLLPHWIEHNHSHENEFRKWSAIAKEKNLNDIAALIDKAIASMNEADRALEDALKKI